MKTLLTYQNHVRTYAVCQKSLSFLDSMTALKPVKLKETPDKLKEIAVLLPFCVTQIFHKFF